jgi:TIGR03009 family protein
MRPVGITLATLLVLASVSWGQPPAPPGVPGMPPGAPGVAPPADPKLDPHLREWEKRMVNVKNFAALVEVKRTDAVFKKERKYGGDKDSRVLCMKPNLAVLRLNDPTNPKNYEAYICNGKSVYEYSGATQTITEYKIPAGAAAGSSDNLMLDFLSGMRADDVKRRFNITLFNEDANYIYLDIKPILGKDQQEFKQIRFALYSPRHTKVAYLPAQVWMMKPNRDTEEWTFADPQTDVPGITPQVFEPVKVNGWTFKQAPAAPPGPGGPPMPPGGTNLPPGPGAVKKQ